MNDLLIKREEILERYIKQYLVNPRYAEQTPLTYSFLITKRCPLKCKHCFNNKITNEYEKKELTVDEYEKISRTINPFLTAFFGGGEPFVRTDFYKIVSLFRKNCKMQWASVTTNGLLQNSILTQVEKICVETPGQKFVLNFSLDGYREQHDLIRGVGVYDKCMDTIRQCNELRKRFKNLSIGIVSTMNTFNETCLAEFFQEISEEIHPNVISLLLTRQAPREGEYIKEIDYNNYYAAQKKLYQLFLEGKNGNLDIPSSFFPFAFYDIISKTIMNKERQFNCLAGHYGAYIDFDGDVNPCEIMNDKLCTEHPVLMGNLRDYDYDFKKLWTSERAKKVRKIVNNKTCCEKCTHETEGILPSLYFPPNNQFYKDRIREYVEKK